MKRYSFLLFLAIFLVACEPDVVKDNTLSIKFNINSGTSPLLYNTNYTVNGMTIQYTDVRFYISQPVFSSGSQTVEFPDAYFLGDAASSNNTFVLGDIGKRTIDGIAFGFGVDSSRNTQTGSRAIPGYAYGVDHPLSSANNMYWAWDPGYIWMKLEGRMDANADLDFGDPGEVFSIHTGIDPAYRFISRTYVFSMNDEPKTIQVDMDVDKFFEGYNLVGSPFVHPMDTTSSEYHSLIYIQDNANLVFGEFYE